MGTAGTGRPSYPQPSGLGGGRLPKLNKLDEEAPSSVGSMHGAAPYGAFRVRGGLGGGGRGGMVGRGQRAWHGTRLWILLGEGGERWMAVLGFGVLKWTPPWVCAVGLGKDLDWTSTSPRTSHPHATPSPPPQPTHPHPHPSNPSAQCPMSASMVAAKKNTPTAALTPPPPPPCCAQVRINGGSDEGYSDSATYQGDGVSPRIGLRGSPPPLLPGAAAPRATSPPSAPCPPWSTAAAWR